MAVNIPGLIAVIVFYIVIFVIGIIAARVKRKNHEEGSTDGDEVMLAGRNLGWFVGCFTMTATWVGGGYINGTAELVYTTGLVWAQAPWGYALSLSLGGMFFAKVMRSKRYVTMLDPLQEKYGNWMGGLLYLPAFLGETMWSASILGALGSTLSIIIDLEIDTAVILSAIIAAGYTFFGGLYSVAYTDVIQLICIFVGLWLAIPFAMTNKVVSSISSTQKEWLGTLEPERTGQWLDYAMHLVCGGLPWQVYFQRVLSAKKTSYAQGLSYFASFGAMFMAIPAVLIGALAKSTDWSLVNMPQKFLAADNKTLSDTRLVLPLVLQYLTPQWVSIFGMGAISAAVMSSADSSILSASSMFAHNIYKLIFRPKASDKEVIWVVRFSILGVGAVATVMALTIKSIYYLFVLCSDLVFVLLFPQLVCAIYIPFANIYGSLSGYIIGLFFRLGGGETLIKLPALIVYPMYNADKMVQLFPYRTVAMLLSAMTLVAVSYLSKYVFERGIVPMKYDILRGFRDKKALEKTKPDMVQLTGTQSLENGNGSLANGRHGKDDLENERSVILRPMHT